jgi:hypothetical protein
MAAKARRLGLLCCLLLVWGWAMYLTPRAAQGQTVTVLASALDSWTAVWQDPDSAEPILVSWEAGNLSVPAGLLVTYPDAVLISLGPLPAHCSLSRPDDFTLRLTKRKTHFASLDFLTCQTCDLPSPPFYLRPAFFRPFAQQLKLLKGSALLFLGLKARGRSLNCNAKYRWGLSQPPQLCPGLPLPFTSTFVFYPKVVGVWRLEVEGESGHLAEFWLGCTWAQSAYANPATRRVACASWSSQVSFGRSKHVVSAIELDGHSDAAQYGPSA